MPKKKKGPHHFGPLDAWSNSALGGRNVGLFYLGMGPGFYCMGSHYVQVAPLIISFDASQRDSFGGQAEDVSTLYR